MRVVIFGAGAIGASVAYFLARLGVRAIIIERRGVACAASGKAGGFLALDWCDGTPLASLARRSFALHGSLPGELNADWGFRRLTTYAGFGGADTRAPARRYHSKWVSDSIALCNRLGSPETTAQVHPGQFTAGMMQAAEAMGAELRLGCATGVELDNDGKVQSVHLGEERIPTDAVVIAMGPWSMIARKWLPLPGVYGLKGHSLIYDTGSRVPPEALFLEYQDTNGQYSPEVFPPR